MGCEPPRSSDRQKAVDQKSPTEHYHGADLSLEDVLRSYKDGLRYSTETVQDCIETDLSVIDTLIRLSKDRYQHGKREEGARAIAQAKKGVEHIRNFLSKTNLLSPEFTKSVGRRCHELELQIIATYSK